MTTAPTIHEIKSTSNSVDVQNFTYKVEIAAPRRAERTGMRSLLS
tara:strand:+ start:386 stop:520 length:135 start_codon:yes stop_codon:yes gene_type:complete